MLCFACEMTLGDDVFGYMVPILWWFMRPLGDKAL